MSEFDNIEEIFKSTLKKHKVEVEKGVWNNIQNNMPSHHPFSSGGGSSLANAVAIKAIVIIVAISGMAVGGYYYAHYHSKTNSNKAAKQTNKNISAENINNAITPNGNKNAKTIVEANPTKKDAASTINLATLKENKLQEKTESAAKTANSTPETQNPNAETANNPQKAQANANESNQNKQETPKITPAATNENNTNGKTVQKENIAQHNIKSAPVKLSINISKKSLKAAPYTVDFSSNFNAKHIVWNFGDGTSVTDKKEGSHSYKSAGTYIMFVTAYNSKSDTNVASKTQTIEFKPKAEITFVPNIITPNGDGINDVFSIKSENVERLSVRIYEGNKLIYSNQDANGKNLWNGKNMGGNMVDDGIYHYVITGVDEDGNSIQPKIGNITLNR